MGKAFRSKHFQNPDVKRNFFLNVFDGAFFSFAMSVISLVTVMPVLVKKISGSDFAIGFIPVIWAAGFNFPQIFIANFVNKIGYKKPLVLVTAIGQRLPWLLLAVFTFFFVEKLSPTYGLILILGGLGLAAIGGSINLPAWFDLVSKITPVQLRGRLFAYRSVMGALLGVLGGWLVIQILNSVKYPDNFALLFLLSFLIMMISYIFLIYIKEDKPNHRALMTYSNFLKKLKEILKSQKNFRNFLVSDSLMMLANMSHAFFTVFALEKFNLSDGYAGTFTIVMMISMIVGSLYFGYSADKFGHKLNLVYASSFTTLACLAALVAPFVEIYFIVFVGSSLNLMLIMVSRLTIIAEICVEEDRPTYVALTNLITAPFVLSGLLAGWITKMFSYEALFIIAGIFSIAAFLWLVFMVKEPRGYAVSAAS